MAYHKRGGRGNPNENRICIMNDLAKLSDLAGAEIEDLRKDGIEPSPAEIVELNALGWAIECPESRLHLSRGVPVIVGGVALWPQTIYAQDWFDRVGCKLPGVRLQSYALGYAMANVRTDLLDIGPAMAAIKVSAWAVKLKCTFGELNEAISQVLQQDEQFEQPPNKRDSGMTIGDLSATLTASLGGDPDFWERRCAASYCYDVIESAVRQNNADGKPHGSDPRIKANRALGWAVEKIRESRNVEA